MKIMFKLIRKKFEQQKDRKDKKVKLWMFRINPELYKLEYVKQESISRKMGDKDKIF